MLRLSSAEPQVVWNRRPLNQYLFPAGHPFREVNPEDPVFADAAEGCDSGSLRA